MKTKLDERFVVDETSQNKDDYIRAINEFINQHEGFRPEEKDAYLKNEVCCSFGSTFLKKYGCILLDRRFFTNGVSLHTSSFHANIFYSSVLQRNVVCLFHLYGGNERFILGESNTEIMTITFVKGLYRKIVANIIDQANLVRKFKIDKDIATTVLSKKFHFNQVTNKGEIFLKVFPNFRPKITQIISRSFSVKYGKINMLNWNNSNYYTVDDIVKKYSKSINTDNVDEIKDMVQKGIEEEMKKLSTYNEATIERLMSVSY